MSEDFDELWQESLCFTSKGIPRGPDRDMDLVRLGFDTALAKLTGLKADMGVPEATTAQLCERAVDRSDTVNTLLAILEMNFDRPTSELLDAVKKLKADKEGAYKERNLCVALIAKFSVMLGYQVGLGRHEGWDWDDDWRTIVFIDLPTGQVSWHIHDSEVEMFNFLRLEHTYCYYPGKWDGHSTEEKYHRLKRYL